LWQVETECVKCRDQPSVELLKIYWEGKHFIDLGTSIMAVLHLVDLLTLLIVCVWSLLSGLAG
jgi:hypothetical protein